MEEYDSFLIQVPTAFCSGERETPRRKAVASLRELKRHADLTLKSTWRNEVSAAKGGLKVIKGLLVSQVNDCEPQRHFRSLGAQKIVCPNTEIEKMTRCDAGWIRVVIFRSVRWNSNPQSP